MSKVWFITESSKGIGRIWAEAALDRGEKVALTARDPGAAADVAEWYSTENTLPLTLDVTDKGGVDAAVAQAREHFGRLDVVVNTAGPWVTEAALPILLEQGSGHIVQVSPIGGADGERAVHA